MAARSVYELVGLTSAAAVLCAALAGPVAAQSTQRVSLSSAGAEGNASSFTHERIDAAISADGRFVAFWSLASDLVEDDTNGVADVFVRDRDTGVTQRVSVSSSGGQGNAESRDPSISADGRYVAFWSHATNLVPGDTNGRADGFVYDRDTATLVRASVDSSGAQASNHSFFPTISADGRFVAFESSAPDLFAGDENGIGDIFVRDLLAGRTERVSVGSGGAEANGESALAAISPDGRYVAFESFATNLVAADTNGRRDVFIRDRQTGSTDAASVGSAGVLGNGDSRAPAISADARFVAFESAATNLVPGDTNGRHDVFLRDRQDGVTLRMSVGSAGSQANGDSLNPSISADGELVTFTSLATNLVPADTNLSDDVFLRDRLTSTTVWVSVASAGTQAHGQSADGSISADGTRIVFTSTAGNLQPGDTNDTWDVFVRERGHAAMASLCDPGISGVLACPCSNTPSGPGRGCNNSSGSGGAILSATGGAYLSSDSLVFETTGEIPTTLSIVMQGTAVVPAGELYGRGVRCAGGVLRTLYSKTASGGSITAPDFLAGDPTVSERSAALGDEILPGQTRWYFVGYRDPIALCPAQFTMNARQTFSATQTGQVTWSP
jgi:Tol biopolymer transport system component